MKIFRNKENFKEELFQFLSNIINLQPKELVNYIINKVDICDYFLKKCNLRKCVEKPLETPDSFCLKNQIVRILSIVICIIDGTEDFYAIFGFGLKGFAKRHFVGIFIHPCYLIKIHRNV